MRIFDDVKKYGKLNFVMWALFYAGVIVGCIFKLPANIFDNIIFKKINFWNLETLNTIIFTEVSAVLTLFIFSFTIFGTIFNFASVFTKGLGIGITIYSLYSKFLIKGIIFGIFAILPGLFISSAALILFAIQSTKINILIIKRIFYKDENLSILKFKSYIKNLSKTLMFSALGAFIHILLSYIFLKLNFFKI